MIATLLTAFNARDAEGWLSNVTDDFEMHSRFSSVGDTVFHGRTGFEAWWKDLDEAWDPILVNLEEAADAEPERTVLLLRLYGRGRGSGLALEEEVAHIWHWRGPKLAKLDYTDRAEAEALVRG